ncbi:recombinase family protein [Bradyrhizobium sp. JYMT SZCCT0428]|uniref:recombinase family protein n=1 Tax=Bradyrhizobium sp. JYMT SZCCT0428 TaxID=2807673 RepID=UPI001BA8B7FD|nr:recombinase family protein [Bradyrhizobium sp. JYMT SZCCT0428]MBR1157187.1 recombinase family protein [Bradyrhizobium sp. JYMT SZCCT0428]
MAVYSYTRVSTTAQAEEGESLGAQQRRVEGYAMQHDLTVDRHFVERGVSGSVPLVERPEGKALLAILKPGDVLITPKLDRMFRSALNALGVLEGLKQQGVSLHMIDLGGDVTGNGISKLAFTILSAVAEAQRDRIRERIADVKRDQKTRGRFLGGSRPFGWQIAAGGSLEPLESERKALLAMRRMQKEGKSLRAIATTMQARGFAISHQGVKQALARFGEAG